MDPAAAEVESPGTQGPDPAEAESPFHPVGRPQPHTGSWAVLEFFVGCITLGLRKLIFAAVFLWDYENYHHCRASKNNQGSLESEAEKLGPPHTGSSGSAEAKGAHGRQRQAKEAGLATGQLVRRTCVAVKELNLNCHDRDMYIYIYTTRDLKIISNFCYLKS